MRGPPPQFVEDLDQTRGGPGAQTGPLGSVNTDFDSILLRRKSQDKFMNISAGRLFFGSEESEQGGCSATPNGSSNVLGDMKRIPHQTLVRQFLFSLYPPCVLEEK